MIVTGKQVIHEDDISDVNKDGSTGLKDVRAERDKQESKDNKQTVEIQDDLLPNVTTEIKEAQQVVVPIPELTESGGRGTLSFSPVVNVPIRAVASMFELPRRVGLGHLKMYEYRQTPFDHRPYLVPVANQIDTFSNPLECLKNVTKLAAKLHTLTDGLIFEPDDQTHPFFLGGRVPVSSGFGEDPFSWDVRGPAQASSFRNRLAAISNPKRDPGLDIKKTKFTSFTCVPLREFQEQSHNAHSKELLEYDDIQVLVQDLSQMLPSGQAFVPPEIMMSTVTRSTTYFHILS